MKRIVILLLFFAPSVWADTAWYNQENALDTPIDIQVYRDPDCVCCHHWIQHLEQHNFKVIDIIASNMTVVKQRSGLPVKLASCHTAIIEGYIIEGHVPAGDIKRLLNERPNIKGLSVPAMPVGTPGMEMGDKRDSFAVIQFDDKQHIDIYNYYQVDANNHYQSSSSKD